MAETPTKVFQKLTDVALELCRAGSAGVSVWDGGQENVFRWLATSGEYTRYCGGTTPREFCPCGTVFDRNCALLMADPVRSYPHIGHLHVPAREALLVPFYRGGDPIGTVWVVAHDDARKFDAEDLRVVTSLTRFAEAAVQLLSRIEDAEKARSEAFRSREALRAALDNIPQRVYWKGLDLTYQGCNRPFARDMGFGSPDEVVGKTDVEAPWAGAVEGFRAADRRVIDTAAPELGCEEVLRGADGRTTWLRTNTVPLRDPDGRVVGVLGTYEDVSERRRVEDELRLRDRAMRVATQGLVITDSGDSDHPLLYVNSGFERITGYPAAEAVGRNCRFLQGPGTDPAAVARLRGAVRAGRAATVELLNYRKDGRPFWNEVAVSPVAEPGGPVTHFVGVITDVTDRRRIEGQLREQEELLREAAELAHVGGWSFDPVTLRGDWTAETARIHGVDPAASPDVLSGLKYYDPEDRPRLEAAVRAVIARGTPYDLELRFTAADGAKKWVRAIGRPVAEGGKVVRVRGSMQDVTARHELEERLRQSQKMDAFGQLAGGVAHDFNNVLQVINGYAALLLDALPAGDPKVELVAEIRQAGERSAALTRQLLAFARQEVVAPQVLDLCAAAAGTSGMLRRLIGADVRLVADLGPGVWPVLIDPGQLEQVLLNLAVNARDAMPGGGTLTVAARNERVTAEAAGHVDARPGPYAVLAVTDTGAGIPPEVLGRIFEPFFTTKGVGRGTGLGLATVYGIVKQAGGHIRVRSTVGEGSTFEVFLPRTGDPKADPPGTGPGAQALPRGAETILVVEDEAAVRGLVRVVLSGCGYKVLVAADGAAAERVSTEHAGPIHLLLSDVVMPGAGGRAAAAGVTARHPEAKVLFMSGYTDDAVVRRGVSAADAAFLQKPFTPDVLAAKVRQVLDSPS